MHHRTLLGKASSHRRCITKHSRTGTRHNSDSKGNVSHGFPTCGPRQLRALTLEKELCQALPAPRLASRKMQFCGAKLFESIWARCHSACREHQKLADRSVDRTSTLGTRKIASDSAKVKTTCEDRLLPLATWLRSANRTASRGTTVNREKKNTLEKNTKCNVLRSRAFAARFVTHCVVFVFLCLWLPAETAVVQDLCLVEGNR